MPGIDIDIVQLHSNRSNHEASQAKVKKNEAKVGSQDQGRSGEIVQCGIHESGQLSRVVS